MTRIEVAALLGCSESSVRRLEESGRLPLAQDLPRRAYRRVDVLRLAETEAPAGGDPTVEEGDDVTDDSSVAETVAKDVDGYEEASEVPDSAPDDQVGDENATHSMDEDQPDIGQEVAAVASGEEHAPVDASRRPSEAVERLLTRLVHAVERVEALLAQRLPWPSPPAPMDWRTPLIEQLVLAVRADLVAAGLPSDRLTAAVAIARLALTQLPDAELSGSGLWARYLALDAALLAAGHVGIERPWVATPVQVEGGQWVPVPRPIMPGD